MYPWQVWYLLISLHWLSLVFSKLTQLGVWNSKSGRTLFLVLDILYESYLYYFLYDAICYPTTCSLRTLLLSSSLIKDFPNDTMTITCKVKVPNKLYSN